MEKGLLISIRVEKMLSSEAVVWVDERWRESMSAENYEEPRNLIGSIISFT